MYTPVGHGRCVKLKKWRPLVLADCHDGGSVFTPTKKCKNMGQKKQNKTYDHFLRGFANRQGGNREKIILQATTINRSRVKGRVIVETKRKSVNMSELISLQSFSPLLLFPGLNYESYEKSSVIVEI